MPTAIPWGYIAQNAHQKEFVGLRTQYLFEVAVRSAGSFACHLRKEPMRHNAEEQARQEWWGLPEVEISWRMDEMLSDRRELAQKHGYADLDARCAMDPWHRNHQAMILAAIGRLG